MSTLAVDHNGNRIKTDILTGGYLREEIEEKLKISIPPEIKHLCFVFWFINICDEWDDTVYKKNILKIDGQTITTIESGFCSIMGCHKVSSGQYEWKLRHFSDVGGCIGIIQDLDLSQEKMSRTLDRLRYDTDGYGAFWEMRLGKFLNGKPVEFMKQYKDKIKNNDVIIGVKIDLDSQRLYFFVDEEEYVEAPYTLQNDKSYRLVASFWRRSGAKIELL